MKKTRRILSVLLCLLMAMSFSSAFAKEDYTFAIISPVVHQFYDVISEGAIEYVEEKGLSVKIVAEASTAGDISEQIRIMEDQITKGVDGIAIGSADAASLTPYINMAMNQGIPVITFDTDAPNSSRLCYVGPNNTEAGLEMANQLVTALGGKGGVLISTGVVSQQNLLDRIDAIEEYLKDYPDIKILQMEASGGEQSKTLANIEMMVEAHPDFDAILQIDAAAYNEVTVWKSKGWTSEDKIIIGFDNLAPVIQGIKDGIVLCSVTQGQKAWGPAIVDLLIDANNGKELPEFYKTDLVVVNAENVMELYPD